VTTREGDGGAPRAPGVAEELVVTVPKPLDGVRVDRAIAMLAGLSRSAASDLVASGRVWVDGSSVAVRSSPLVAGQLLRLELAAPALASAAEPEIPLEVVHADDDLVVVDKPAGLVVHPGPGHRRGTLVGGLLARFPDIGHLVESGECEPARPGIVHRLDRGTSGLLVVARSARAYRSLRAQLAARTVERGYLALVSGLVGEDRGAVEAPIGRSARDPGRMAVSARGRPARTDYAVLARYTEPAPATLLSLRLHTGRTHQIRVHLSAIGHPVLGDDRYGGPRGGLPEGRLFLHADRLGFDHPDDGARRRWRSALPADLAGALPTEPPLAWEG